MENYGNTTGVLSDSFSSVSITFYCDKPITGVSSDYFTFTQDANNANMWVGVPTNESVEPGELITCPIEVTTDGATQHFGYNSCFFKWN